MSRPLTFRFNGPDNAAFSCPLECSQCTALKADGNRCTKRSCIGVPVCWMHLLKSNKLRIKDSPHHGKGLFAQCNTSGANDVVFRPGQEIVRYEGERVTQRVLDQRYGDSTAPYGVACNPENVRRRRGRGRGGSRTFEDAACVRGVGSLANHGGARANAELACVNRRVVLRATADIRNGREVLVDYGDEYLFNEENTQHTTRRMKRPN
jgi:hypothetical protein